GRRPRGAGHARRAVLPRAGLGPAGAVDPPRPGPAGSRQPPSLPGDSARGGGPARIGRLVRPQALARPGGEWLPPPLVGLGPRRGPELLPRPRQPRRPLRDRRAVDGGAVRRPARTRPVRRGPARL